MLISALLVACLSLPGCGGGGADADGGLTHTTSVGDSPSTPQPGSPVATPPAGPSTDPTATDPPPTEGPENAGQNPLASGVAAADIIAELNPSKATGTPSWYGVNCYGQIGPLRNFPNEQIYGPPLADGSTLRMGRVDDPLNPGRKVYLVKVGQDDVLTAGGKRCELIAYGDENTHLPMAQNIWFGVSVLVDQGRNSRGDDQIIMQWHTLGFSPFFAVLLQDGKLRAQVRYNARADGTPANSTLETVWTDTAPVQRKWMTFVVNARISPFASDRPFIKVWRDGVQIVNRSGPLGYNSTQYSSARVGLYHWVNSGNTWDPAAPVRSLMFGRAFFAKDPNGQYSEPAIRGYTQAN